MIKLGAQPPVTSSYTNLNACVTVGSDRPDAVQLGDSKIGHELMNVTLSPAAFTSLVSFARTASV